MFVKGFKDSNLNIVECRAGIDYQITERITIVI